jgi:ABC-type transport system substrate-binding protein
MRQMLSLAVALCALATAVSCDRSAASPARAVPRGEFRVLTPAPPLSLNPDVVLDELAYVIGRNVFNHLVSLNEAGRILPELARSWTTSPDGLVYTLALERNVRWHDGVPFSSADVRWTLETIATQGFAGREVLAPVSRIETPDEHTVVLTLRHPWSPLMTDLTGAGLAILPRHIYNGRDLATHPANRAPVGTGPFRFSRWHDDGTVVLVANDRYFRTGPYVERVIFRPVAPERVAELLRDGEADYSLVRPHFEPHAVPDRLEVHTLPTSARFYIAMNLRRAPFADVRVRRALASAVDRLAIVQGALGGVGAPALGWYTPDVEWAYNPAARVPVESRDEAARLLDQAGVHLRDGVRFRAAMVVPNAPPLRDIAEALRAQLAAVGIALTVERLGPAEWPRRILVERDFDLTVLSGAQGPDPDQLRRRFLGTTQSGAYIGYEAADFRAAVEEGARAVDIDARAAAYARAQEALARDVPIVPLAESVKVVVHHRRVTGLPQLEARGLVGAFDFSLVKVATGSTGAMP